MLNDPNGQYSHLSDRPDSWDDIRAELGELISGDDEAAELERVVLTLQSNSVVQEPMDGFDDLRRRLRGTGDDVRDMSRRAVYIVAALAACLAVSTIAALVHSATLRKELTEIREGIARVESITAGEISEQDAAASRTVFDEIARYYDGKAAWLAMSGPKVQVGLADGGSPGAPGTTDTVVVRITLSDGSAQPHFMTDIVTHWGVSSAFRNVLPDGTALSYAVAPLSADEQGAIVQFRVQVDEQLGSTKGGEQPDVLMATVRLGRDGARQLGLLRIGGHTRRVIVSVQWEENPETSSKRA